VRAARGGRANAPTPAIDEDVVRSPSIATTTISRQSAIAVYGNLIDVARLILSALRQGILLELEDRNAVGMNRFEDSVDGGLGFFIEDREFDFEPRWCCGSY
jgi:hypothetical protein